MGSVSALSRKQTAADAAAALDAVTKQQNDATNALQEYLSNKNIANGYAGLGAGAQIALTQLIAHRATHQAGATDALLSVTVAKTASYTVVDADEIILVTPAAATTITLPTPVARAGKRFLIKKTGPGGVANTVIIATAAGLIDGVATETIMVAGGFRELVSDGTNWHIVGGTVIPVIYTAASPANAGTLALDAATASTFRVATGVAGFTLAAPTNPVDGEQINIEITPTVTFSLTVAAAILLTTGITTPIAVAANKKAFLGLRYSGTVWYLIASTIAS